MIDNIVNTEWIEVLDVILRSVLSLITLFLVTKMLGKKQVSQLSVFDYVVGISIGNFAAEMTFNLDSQYMNGIVSIVMFGLVAYLVSYATIKSIFLRRFFMGTPTLLIQDGKLLYENMQKAKLDINDVLEECRSAGYFDVSDISYALLEVNGKISILPKEDKQMVTIGDMGIKNPKASLCANVVIDGNVMKENLKLMDKTVKWLKSELKKQGYSNYNNILLATLNIHDELAVYEKNIGLQPKDVLE